MLRAARTPLPPVPATTVEGLYATGYWLFTQKRVAHALVVFRALIHLSPYDERGWVAVGACYEAQDQPDLALVVYGASLRMIARAPRCQLARARVLRSLGRPTEAQLALVEAARAAARTTDAELRALIAAERYRWDRDEGGARLAEVRR
jgi:predicted Zn-dependent protease